ncbi:MAG: nucleoside kinase [Lachnospiraceae bacterium]|nr:nucleoside kinase [Lachnospiraceae bacterium]
MEMYKGVVRGQEIEFSADTTLYQLAKKVQPEYSYPIALAVKNGKICELYHHAGKNSHIEFITIGEKYGMEAYRRSVTLLMLKAFYDVCGIKNIKKIEIKHSLGHSLFCAYKGKVELTKELLFSVQKKMEQMVRERKPIRKRHMETGEAIELFRRHRMYEKEKLFRFRKHEKVPIYELDGFEDYFYGHMLPNTENLKNFGLSLFEDGFLLHLPSVKNPLVVPEETIPQKLSDTLLEADDWIKRMEASTIGELNEQIVNGNITELMLVQEALQERKIAEIAKTIAEDYTKKIVLIAGPSSSGKTTFSHRLSIQLRAYGLKPHPIAVDDYFVDREFTPRDADGKYDFEAIEAVDIEQFQKDMLALIAGEAVELPTFNFMKGCREYKGKRLQLAEDDILVIEGIHCLNDRLTSQLPKERKFKIYLSALTQLNVDEHNRIPTADCRMLRRMVRDARTRNLDAKATLAMWASVRRGEEKNIFPYQEEADVMFNSTLIYELSVLKQFAEPLLFTIGPEDEYYPEAKRMLDFLDYFLGVTSEHVPNNSLLREFIGGSCFS